MRSQTRSGSRIATDSVISSSRRDGRKLRLANGVHDLLDEVRILDLGSRDIDGEHDVGMPADQIADLLQERA